MAWRAWQEDPMTQLLDAKSQDFWPDYLLAGLAIAPDLIALIGPSSLGQRIHALTPRELYFLYRTRPILMGLGLVGLAGLALRNHSSKPRGQSLRLATQAVTG